MTQFCQNLKTGQVWLMNYENWNFNFNKNKNLLYLKYCRYDTVNALKQNKVILIKGEFHFFIHA